MARPIYGYLNKLSKKANLLAKLSQPLLSNSSATIYPSTQDLNA